MNKLPEKKRRDMSREDDLRCMVMMVAPFITLMVTPTSSSDAPEPWFIAGSAAACGLVFAVRLVFSPVSLLCRVVASLFAVLNGMLLSGVVVVMVG